MADNNISQLIQVLSDVALQLRDLVQSDPLLLHRPLGSSSSTTTTSSPLHLACKVGRTEFVLELLCQNLNLLEELDPNDKSTVLHIAVRNGHLELVNHLVLANPSMCFLRDTHGRTPIHVAVVKGQLHILELLLRVMPAAAKERAHSGDTIMHLCVYYNQLDALRLVMKMVGDSGLLNATNIEGNAILHVAVANKHLEIVEYLLSDKRLNKNMQNSNGMTAMDVLKDSGINRNNDGQMRLMLKRENILRSEDMKRVREREKHFDWMEKQRSALMVVASLIASMAFQAGISPPGEVWQDNGPENYSTNPILALNSVGFVLSMSSILMLTSGFPCRRFFMVLTVVKMWAAIYCITFSYAFSTHALKPTISYYIESNIRIGNAYYSIYVWIFLLTFWHTVMWMVRLIKHCRRRWSSSRQHTVEH